MEKTRQEECLLALPLGELSPKVTERARMLTERNRRSDSIALSKRQFIAAWRLSGDGLALSVSLRSPRPGCGSQRLLRCRSHPAGRGPNSYSLFPPLAAVVAVALFSRFSDLLLRSRCYLSADGNVQQKREIFGEAVNGRSTKKCV